jgi:NAD-dependent SIR2 family protein deacetylase
MKKRLFVLGAGFSKAAGAPSQSEILSGLASFDKPSLLQKEEIEAFQRSFQQLSDFLRKNMLVRLGKQPSISLEDIYTPLDKCILNGYSFRNLSTEEVVKMRKTLDTVIALYMKEKLCSINTSDTYLQRFADELIQFKSCNLKADSIAIISTNWDILLDNAIYRALEKKVRKGVIDYCCHMVAFDDSHGIIPALIAKERCLFTIKLIKLHGSLNWLYCPRCGRLYASWDKEIGVMAYTKKPICRLCKKNYGNKATADSGPSLVTQLLMPTYIKDLNNVQIKLLWQNAGVELSEASKIIFIGYSFPAADYEFRQLLARMVPHGCEIEVVLYGEKENKDAAERYRSFFGTRKVKFIYDGAENYLSSNQWEQ